MCTESDRVVPTLVQATAADLNELRACRRRKLWEIPPAYHCAIVGTCLPMSDLRRLARRTGIEQWQSASDYQLHHAAVNITCKRNALSQLVDKELVTRFAPVVRRFAQASTDEHIRALWNDAIGRGDVAAALWAVMSHAYASESARESASQDIHMLSHQAGAASRADLRRLAALECETENLRQASQRQRQKLETKLAEKEKVIAEMTPRAAAAAILERRLQDAEKRLRVLEQGDALAQARELAAAQTLRAQRAEERASKSERKLVDSEARVRQLEQALEQAKLPGRRERHEDGNVHPSDCSCRAFDDTEMATDPDLAGRRVLCVGGRSGVIGHYRAVVEQRQGRFLHHDGGLEDNFARLEALLASADAVVCAARHISHGAYYVVKRFCKKHGKPCILLKNDGASSFLRGVRALAGRPTEAGVGDTVLITARA